MGIISDIAADRDRCQHCGKPLARNYGGHELYETLRIYGGDIVDAFVADVRCSACGHANEIFWQRKGQVTFGLAIFFY